MASGNLFIVSTPIGNMQDITIRGLKILFEVDVIFSEKASKTSLLLTKLLDEYPSLISRKEKPKIISFNEFEEEGKIYEVINLLMSGLNVALVSEAGTPLISDPGFKLVRNAQKKGIKIITIPGPSAVIAALSVSSLPTDKFLFLGFIPKQSKRKTNYFQKLKDTQKVLEKDFNPTIIFFESPHRIHETLVCMKSVFGEIEVVIARELTKIHEEVLKNTISELLENTSIKNARGEFVVLFSLK